MKQTKKKGNKYIFLGVLAVLAALMLLFCNEYEQWRAAQTSGQVLEQMQNDVERKPALPDKMTEICIDGEMYIGRLKIPDLNLELPVMSQWSYPNLKKAPCRYCGTTYDKDLVLLGHNYRKSFKYLYTLKPGAKIEFRDADDKIWNYQVEKVETVAPTEVEKVTSGEYDLTMFTCTYDGRYRTVIRCTAVDSE